MSTIEPACRAVRRCRGRAGILAAVVAARAAVAAAASAAVLAVAAGCGGSPPPAEAGAPRMERDRPTGAERRTGEPGATTAPAATVAAAAASAPAAPPDLTCGAPGAQAAAPSYRCRRTARPVVIDGDIADAAWKDAVWVDLAPAEPPSPDWKGLRTRAAALFDDRFIYVAWECEDGEIISTLKKRDDPIWSEDCVEFFLSQMPGDGVYFEFEVNPDGVLFDALIVRDAGGGRHAVLSWNPPKAAAAAGRTAGGYTVELAVPLGETFSGRPVPPWHGDRWRGNFYRIDCSKEGAFDYGFSPVRDFHDTSKFCEIVFEDGENDRTAKEYATAARQWLETRDGAGWWTLGEHLESAVVSSPAAGLYPHGEDGFRSPQKRGLGRLIRPQAPKNAAPGDIPLRGELLGHPNAQGDPLIVEIPVGGTGEGMICLRSDPKAARRILQGL
ncbi:MAG: carbohydrate-binding family 9-like protein, partial [Planctomycetota bacterium]|nr:carbohydrate-binding family 9-like protein [Planctomycetota bacterium]